MILPDGGICNAQERMAETGRTGIKRDCVIFGEILRIFDGNDRGSAETSAQLHLAQMISAAVSELDAI